MRKLFIITDRKDFEAALIRGENLPHGVSILSSDRRDEWMTDPAETVIGLRINLRDVSSTAFSLWILRRLRSIQGKHRIEILGREYRLQMPQAIDQIAEAIVNGRESKARTAA